MNKKNYDKIFKGEENTDQSNPEQTTIEKPLAPDVENSEHYVIGDGSIIPYEPKTAKVVCRGKLNVRKIDSIDSEILYQLNPNDEIQVKCIYGDWAHIYTSFGIEGYVMIKFIAINNP